MAVDIYPRGWAPGKYSLAALEDSISHYLSSSTLSLFINAFLCCFSCLLDVISTCFFVLCLGQFVLNLSFPQNSRSSCGRAQQQLAARIFTHLPSKILKEQRWCYQYPTWQTRRPAGLHLQGGSFRYTLRLNSSSNRDPCSQIL